MLGHEVPTSLVGLLAGQPAVGLVDLLVDMMALSTAALMVLTTAGKVVLSAALMVH